MATVKFVDEARNLYKLDIVVVAITPFTLVVKIELLSLNEILLELINEVVDTSPFIIDVKVLIVEFNEF